EQFLARRSAHGQFIGQFGRLVAHSLIHEQVEEGLLALDVVIKRTVRHSHLLGDVGHPRADEPLIDEVEFFFGGGTVFDRWMEEAVRLVDQDRFDRADVIVLSDGIAFISKRAETEWRKRKAERRMRSYGVLIGEARGLKVLGCISDAVMTLDDLKQDQDVLEPI